MYRMKLSEDGTLDRPASMSRRKQLRPFKVQDDDDDDDKNDNGKSNAKQANSTDNGLETTPNGNNTDETLHSTPESGKLNVCMRARECTHTLVCEICDLYLPNSIYLFLCRFDIYLKAYIGFFSFLLNIKQIFLLLQNEDVYILHFLLRRILEISLLYCFLFVFFCY